MSEVDDKDHSGSVNESPSPKIIEQSHYPTFDETFQAAVCATVRSSRFYFDDRHITFKVENELLRIPIRHFLVHAPDVFQSMIDQAPPDGTEVEGNSDDNPVVLAGVDLEDFEALVGYFNQDLSDFSGTKDEWISILRLADMWSMDRVRRTACEKLYNHPFDAIEMLELAGMYHVPYQWAAPAFYELVLRSAPLTVYESLRIKPEWAAAIACVLHKNSGNAETPETVLTAITAALTGQEMYETSRFIPSKALPNGPLAISNAEWGITTSLRGVEKSRKKEY
ncbi:hypothetical protein DL96DRAFT_1607494 [Flagelloscypha sp. PMI_526]|nr:hypothetical protein DL96DRAFT_1607494 [Flagelloscypha sp. PMI_526]